MHLECYKSASKLAQFTRRWYVRKNPKIIAEKEEIIKFIK